MKVMKESPQPKWPCLPRLALAALAVILAILIGVLA